MPNLTYLNLARNKFGSAGAIALASGFEQLRNLTYLDLASNYFGSEGAIALASGFAQLRYLIDLNLSCNNIDNEGVIALANSIKYISKLMNLYLTNNNIGNKGAIKLVKNFPIKKYCSIDLSYNYLTEESYTLTSTVDEKYQLILNNQKIHICIPNVNGSHTNIEKCKENKQ